MLTFIVGVVCPFDHKVFPVEQEDEVKVTDPPSQNVNAPLADIVGVCGDGVTLTIIALLGELVHPDTKQVAV